MITAVAAALALSLTGPSPAPGTPSLAPNPHPQASEAVSQIVKCGSRMYAAGKFGPIDQGGRRYARHGVFSFSASPPYRVTGWAPDVNGSVNTITFAGGNCARAYIGGTFTSVNGAVSMKYLAEVSTSTGKLDWSFRPGVSGPVGTLLGYKNHLLVGGRFPGAYYSLNPATGKHDGFTSGLDISGNLSHSPQRITGQQLSPNGKRMLVEGSFTRVAGHSRRQIFMLNLDGPRTTLTGWTSPDFSQACIRSEQFYVRDATWSPDGSRVYIATDGTHAMGWHGGSLTGLCDAVAAFPSRWESVGPLWRNFTGCDSLYSVAADGGTVWAAGHQRWVNNRDACNKKGPHALSNPGLTGLTTAGAAERNSGKPRYYMARANAADLLRTSAGLWIASSNQFNANSCEGQSGHAGICLLRLGS